MLTVEPASMYIGAVSHSDGRGLVGLTLIDVTG